jgi:sec-independent protein translocase protein TatA
MFGLGPFELVVIGAIAVMLYGKRLPEVGRTFGQTIGELRRQWATLSKDLDVTTHIEGRGPPSRRATRHDAIKRDDEPVATVASPRFEPPAAPGP